MDDDRAPRRVAVVLPGRTYGPHAPLPRYATDAAEARGARPHPVCWAPPENAPELTTDELGAWACAEAAPVLDGVAARFPAGGTLVIGKSLGSYAAPLAAVRGLPAVWLTPVLTAGWVVEGLRRATAPCLLVGGTADRLWDGRLARELSPHVLEVDGADHGMYVPGPLAASAAVLGRVATAVDEFLDGVLWR